MLEVQTSATNHLMCNCDLTRCRNVRSIVIGHWLLELHLYFSIRDSTLVLLSCTPYSTFGMNTQ